MGHTVRLKDYATCAPSFLPSLSSRPRCVHSVPHSYRSLMGNLDPESTLVVTTVHDCQVVDDMPPGELTKHDVPVDVIVTPTRVIRVSERVGKPSGVL